MTHPKVSPEVISDAIVGNRRAHQYLRLVDLGRRTQAGELLESLDAAALVFMAGTLASVARICAGQLPEGPAPTLERLDELEAMFETHKNTMEELRAWVIATADEAMRATADLWPNRKHRISFFENSARTAFDGEESGSHVRRTIFRER